MHAAEKGHAEIAELLVKNNADVNVINKVRINTKYIYVYTIDYSYDFLKF